MKEIMRVILNCLPPSRNNAPSPGITSLKCCLQKNKIDTKIIYWNLIFEPIFDEYKNNLVKGQEELLHLVPFLYLLLREKGDLEKQRRLINFLQRIEPSYKFIDSSYYLNSLEEQVNKIYDLMQLNLDKNILNDVKLFGISCKFSSWIPGMILAEFVKKIKKDINIVIGGFGNKNTGLELMKKSNCFDFAIWGEGEYPLLKLYEELNSNYFNHKNLQRTIYRSASNLFVTSDLENRVVSFQDIGEQDYDDYFNQLNGLEENLLIQLPIEGSRGCHWNRCKFCALNTGYNYRRKQPKDIINNIVFLYEKYNLKVFNFMDNDVIGDLNRFEILLDEIIKLSYRLNVNFSFFAEVIPTNLNSNIIRKMALAGFTNIQIGYEALSERLLKNMDKSNDIADNILFIKFAIKYGITLSGVNMIPGTPIETEEDIHESISNLYLLRFYLGDKNLKFYHNKSIFGLERSSRFYREMSNKDRNAYRENTYDYYLPNGFVDFQDRFNLFSYVKELDHGNEWDNFYNIEQYYLDSKINYKILQNKNIIIYKEYLDDKEITSITFDEPYIWKILSLANNTVVSFNYLSKQLIKESNNLNEDLLKIAISRLRDENILYHNKELTRIVSIIDVQEL